MAPEIERDIAAVIEKKVPVYVVGEDAAERGIPEGGLLKEVERVSRTKLARLFDDYDRIIHW